MKAFIIALAAALPLTIAASQASATTYYKNGPEWAQKAFESHLGDD